MSGGVPGMRQRTSRPSVRVSSSRTVLAASHRACGSASTTRRWKLRTPGSPAQRSMASSITSVRVRCRGCRGSSSTRRRRTGSTASSRRSTTAGSTRCSGRREMRVGRARPGAARRPRAADRRRRRRDRASRTEGIVAPRRRRQRDDARPEPAPALARAPQAGAAGVHDRAGRRRGPPVRHRPLRPLRLLRLDRVLAGPAGGDRRGLPRRQAGRASRCVVGPLPPRRRARPARSPTCGCCSRPSSSTASGWTAAGFTDLEVVYVAPGLARRRPLRPRRSPAASRPPARRPRAAPRARVAGRSAMTPRRWARWVAGSAAGAVFVPIGGARPACVARAARADERRARRAAAAHPRRRRASCGASRARTPSSARRSASLGIFAIAAHELGPLPAGRAAFHLFWTLVAALAVNVFIVGLNQLEDVEIDRINKPRPAAGGRRPVAAPRPRDRRRRGVLPLVLALTQGWIETRGRRRRAGDRRRLLVAAAAAEALPGARRRVDLDRPRARRQPRRLPALRGRVRRRPRGRPGGVGADARSCCRSASRSPCSRTSRTPRATAATASSPSPCGSARGARSRSGMAALTVAYVGMAVSAG